MFKKILLLGLLVFIFVALVYLSKNNDSSNDDPALAELGEPIDTVSDFYNDWFNARTSTDTDPYAIGLPEDQRLTDAVQTYIKTADRGAEKDPVLCLTQLPPRVGAKEVFNLNQKAQYIVLPRGIGGVSPDRAVVDVAVIDNAWKITKIDCTTGESAPEREFAFERTGNLLKHNEPPLDPNLWYVVFEENGKAGHVAPLYFNDASVCVSPEGDESICDPNAFINASEATVKGDMSEAGVEVKRIEFSL